jgi:hypothetical protein
MYRVAFPVKSTNCVWCLHKLYPLITRVKAILDQKKPMAALMRPKSISSTHHVFGLSRGSKQPKIGYMGGRGNWSVLYILCHCCSPFLLYTISLNYLFENENQAALWVPNRFWTKHMIGVFGGAIESWDIPNCATRRTIFLDCFGVSKKEKQHGYGLHSPGLVKCHTPCAHVKRHI